MTVTRTQNEWATRNAEMLKAAWADLDKANAINADLLAALQNLTTRWDRGETPIASDWTKARAAIARANGEHNTLDAFARAAVSRITRGD